MNGVYKAIPQNRVELCQPVNPEDWDTLKQLLNGEPRAGSWKPIRVHYWKVDEKGRPHRPTDSPWLSHITLVFKRSGVDALRPLLEEYGEFLPLDCPDEELHAFNALRVLPDALDEEASEIERFDHGAIMYIPRHEFRPHVIQGVQAFKIPNVRVSALYLGEGFVKARKAARFTGLDFKQVWPPAETGN